MQNENNLFKESLINLTSDDLEPEKKEKKEKSGVFGRILWGLLALALFGVFVYSASLAVGNVVDYVRSQKDLEDIAGKFSPVSNLSEAPANLKQGSATYAIADFQTMEAGKAFYPVTEETPEALPEFNPGSDRSGKPDPNLTTEKYEQFKTQLANLQAACNNEDIFAWVYIPGTNIDYPVVIASAAKPEYYLKYDVSKKYNTAGSIYMDYRNDRNLLVNQFTVFYGHNIRTRGTMFNRLIEFTNEEMFNNYRYIYVYTLNAALKYEIFSIYEAHSKESPTITINNFSESKFYEKISAIKDQSLFQREGLELDGRDHVLMLYTCANTASALTNNDIRCFLTGVLVDAVS